MNWTVLGTNRNTPARPPPDDKRTRYSYREEHSASLPADACIFFNSNSKVSRRRMNVYTCVVETRKYFVCAEKIVLSLNGLWKWSEY